MKWRILILLVMVLAGLGAVGMAFVLWESYARPSFSGGWSGNRYSALGWDNGSWAWEEGPIAFEYKKDGTKLLESLTGPFADFAKSDDRQSPTLLPESGWSEVRIRPAADEGAWNESMTRKMEAGAPIEALRAEYNSHIRYVYATRYRWIPLQWIPFALIGVSLSLAFLASRSFGRISCSLGTLSLIFAVLLAVVWVRSYWRRDELQFGSEALQKYKSVSAIKGGVEITSAEIFGMTFVPDGWSYYSRTLHAKSLVVPHFRVLGFGFERYTRAYVDAGSTGSTLSFPIAVPLALALVWPTLLCRRMLRLLVRDPNACVKCGYDLRASVERCPECG